VKRSTWSVTVLCIAISMVIFNTFFGTKKEAATEKQVVPVVKKVPPEKNQGKYATAITCMDGKGQGLVKNYIIEHYNIDWVDLITHSGANKILAENFNTPIVAGMRENLGNSVFSSHKSKLIAIVGHSGCLVNKAGKNEQIIQLRECEKRIRSWGFGVKEKIILLFWTKNPRTIQRVW